MTKSWGRRGALAVFAVLAVQAVVIGALVSEVRALKGSFSEVRQRRALPSVGDYVPAAALPLLAGDSLSVGSPAPGRAEVLVAVAHDCAVSLAAMAELQALAAERAATVDWRWVALSPADSAAAFVARFALTDPVVLPTVRSTRLLGFKGTPVLVIVDARGQIRHVRAGPLSSAVARDSVLRIAEEVAAESAVVAFGAGD